MKKKVIIPSICFAVLSTPAFEKVMLAAQPEAPANEVTSASTKTEYAEVDSEASLNVYSSPSADSSVLAKIDNGSEVVVYDEVDGWAKVMVDGQEGYVRAAFLVDVPSGQIDLTLAVPEPEIRYVNVKEGSNLNLREGASTETAIIGKLPRGTAVTVYSEQDGWAKVNVNGKEGYVCTDYLTDQQMGPGVSPAETGLAITSAPENTVQYNYSAQTTVKYVNVNPGSNLHLRQGPSTSTAILDKLPRGTQLTVYSEENGWAKVKVNGKEGYVSTQYVSSTKPASGVQEAQAVTKYVNVNPGSRLNLRANPGTSSAIIDQLPRGAKVTVYSEANGWAKVKANGKEGYMSTKYLSSSQPSAASNTQQIATKYVNVNPGSRLNLRSVPSTSGTILTQLPRGTKVTVYSENNGWAKVTANGYTGYVSTTYLSNQQVEQVSNPKMPSRGVVKPENIKTVYQNYDISLDRMAQIQMSAKPQKLTASGWVHAGTGDVRYYLNPSNFVNAPAESLQFLKLSASAKLNANEVNAKILAGKGILEGKAEAFIEAGKKYGVNEIYLIAHALLETGNGSSALANGIQINGKTVYNMYGIGASDGNTGTNGAQRAYEEGWFTPEDAIIGGAKFIAQKYIYAGQDTLYEMRWNPAAAANNGTATHQYATDIQWAVKQAKIIYKYAQLLENYEFVLEVPKYQ